MMASLYSSRREHLLPPPPPCVLAATLTLPSFCRRMFMHMRWFDGLLEGRLAVSRDGRNANYVDAPNGQQPFLPLGVNRCGDLVPASEPAEVEWCADTPTMQASDFDSSAVYTAPGYAESPNGESLYVYYGGMAYPHGEEPSPKPGMHNSGVGAAKLRIDG